MPTIKSPICTTSDQVVVFPLLVLGKDPNLYSLLVSDTFAVALP
jgi:hypothetical protein